MVDIPKLFIDVDLGVEPNQVVYSDSERCWTINDVGLTVVIDRCALVGDIHIKHVEWIEDISCILLEESILEHPDLEYSYGEWFAIREGSNGECEFDFEYFIESVAESWVQSVGAI